MDSISTYVFMNIEATGLRDDGPDIEQLSLIAVKRKKLLEDPQSPDLYKPADELFLEDENCEDITKLSQAFMKFIKTLKKPVCLVAYHGFKFHFPVLKSKLIMSAPSFVCADAMAACYDILDPKPKKSEDSSRVRGAFPWKPGRTKKQKLRKYGLHDVYCKVLGDRPEPDEFECDARARNKALIKIVTYIAEDFVEWVDENNFEYSRVVSAKKKEKRESGASIVSANWYHELQKKMNR